MTARVIPIRSPAPTDEVWSDEAVAHACASGDPAAFACLFDRFHGPVTRFLSRAVGTGPDIEDLLQTTFLEVARASTRFDGRSTVLTWVLGIAANVARHHLRSKARRFRLIRAVAQSTFSSSHRSPADAVEARMELERAQEELERLAPDQRLAFVMCEMEGMSAREAARALGTTETAVWKRVSEARKTLIRAIRGAKS